MARWHSSRPLAYPTEASRSGTPRSAGRTPDRRCPADLECDVCIVGGGLTGLWTAYYLAKAEPGLRIVVLEAEFVGYGASGRNGGWLSAELPGNRDRYARGPHGVEGVDRLAAELRATVDEVIGICRAEQIEADIVRNGVLFVARSPAQLARLRDDVRRAADGRQRSASGSGSPAPSAARSTPTAPACNRRGWCRGWPTSYDGSASRSTSRPASPRSSRGLARTETRDRAGAVRAALPGGLHRRVWPASGAPGCR